MASAPASSESSTSPVPSCLLNTGMSGTPVQQVSGGEQQQLNVEHLRLRSPPHRQHGGDVVGLLFSPDGDSMYSAGAEGSLARYDSSEDEHSVVKVECM